ncbi:hypothetical protein [Aquimarina brevivitae]|uniref:Uncharacterized protein n=1 Tax=Aquimarina brevivitae TaxID=323412 RepID=A0A4Q7PGQ7_9FLAO|nr:hypothetical protein [Aquimarina brevivitae]RZS99704.1 hypothetical protein EV197_0927 [Aquimarina brevivitae]
MRLKTYNNADTGWTAPKELHNQAIVWLSDLKFYKEEQHFLENLIEQHTFQLIKGALFDKSKEVISELNRLKKEIEPLIKRVINHTNNLTLVIDSKEESDEVILYRVHQKELFDTFRNYSIQFMEVKKAIFAVISSVMKQDKQQRLLN